jgi:hypothetical protein
LYAPLTRGIIATLNYCELNSAGIKPFAEHTRRAFSFAQTFPQTYQQEGGKQHEAVGGKVLQFGRMAFMPRQLLEVEGLFVRTLFNAGQSSNGEDRTSQNILDEAEYQRSVHSTFVGQSRSTLSRLPQQRTPPKRQEKAVRIRRSGKPCIPPYPLEN